ncbi:MAG TPA: UDP-3-O-(3-hydroxymyristoyl)glucosamine N-acyltransferase [Bacteroidales bacterium]|jgi:UDP-3-O-[3-hydroxymyristoyl] glucosamine N-acyltransferase|nr:UDP-3-O-(3-hydroxymyristoyl)glucosamine N-acyltransferase [Bacteroidales bacterium]NLD62468.1 UDP-3-O-(3-hydroxymyristoyl)glucosamine N-acyltransferase [Bacteroidales bacterium]HNT94178.1 UDP-3-O-(3-hydroxymyristoyl)glucosamine N-acyltransferase [Bacteroidales bacterium]HOO66582.1 UDP-3-O-(3-hydroxymyristoyl)glucosamine N-acyltransferase [Bacteroidales bacterium]HPE22330.1 UDP-3-O-(3-hydroxymyristoyl)glucosamine N-acyltransferase [Bacteroidales bacterium]
MEFTAAMIAGVLNGTVEGDPQIRLNTVARIEEGHAGALTFLSNPKYEPFVYTTGASAILVNKDFKPSKDVAATLIRVDDPYQALARLLAWYEQARPAKKGIHPSAVIDDTATMGEDLFIGAHAVISENAVISDGCSIHPQVFIGENVTIGKNCTLHPGVKVYRDCVIGNGCILHAGAVIGADGFGFAPVTDANYMKIPQIGNVIIEDNVEIGSNTCIDRATMGSTIIRKGVKLDNLIQVGHNVEIGENTVIAAQSGLAGSTRVGRNCMFGGQVGLAGHLSIADGCKIGAQSGVMSTISEENTTLLGYPATDSKQFLKSVVYIRKLPELSSRVDALTKAVDSLKNR